MGDTGITYTKHMTCGAVDNGVENMGFSHGDAPSPTSSGDIEIYFIGSAPPTYWSGQHHGIPINPRSCSF